LPGTRNTFVALRTAAVYCAPVRMASLAARNVQQNPATHQPDNTV